MKFLNFFYFYGSFLPSWIWIRIRILNTDPDPLTWLNPDPIGIRFRIRNPAQTWGIFALVFNHWVTLPRNPEVRHLFYWDFKDYIKLQIWGPVQKKTINSCHPSWSHMHALESWMMQKAGHEISCLYTSLPLKQSYDSANVVMQIN
jgi:hypothetical protein